MPWAKNLKAQHRNCLKRRTMPSHTHAEQWLRQLLLYRYSILLSQLKNAFPLTEEQESVLRQKVLSIAWIDGAFNNTDK